ncbi:MAG: arylmalonate decarboxylase [Rhizobiaceae bacterium]
MAEKDIACIGMIVPPAAGLVPPEPAELFPNVHFIASGLGLTELTPKGYDGVIDLVADCAKDLAARGADVISLMGTSLSFYRGPEFNTQLINAISEAAQCPATTMTSSVLEALRRFDCYTLAVGTAYGESVNRPLRDYLSNSGFEVQNLSSMDIVDVEDVFKVTDDELMQLGQEATSGAPNAQALFLSCGGLNTASITRPLEKLCNIPVVSSAMAGTWGAMRLAGLDYRLTGYGRLFEN